MYGLPQSRTFFSNDVHKLVQCWTKYIKKQGAMLKKQCNYGSYIVVVLGKVVPVLNKLSTTPPRNMGEWLNRSTFS
jgi:hypothetical protein